MYSQEALKDRVATNRFTSVSQSFYFGVFVHPLV